MDIGYEVADPYWTDFVIEGYGKGGYGVNGVAAIKMVAADTIPAGAKVELSDPSVTKSIYYTFGQTVQSGDAVMWIDSRIEDIVNSEEYWDLSVMNADGDGWYAPPIAFTFMREV